MKRQVIRPMSDSLQVRECMEEVRTPGRSPIVATELGEFRFGLLLKPKVRKVEHSMDYVTVKVYTSGVGQTCGE